MKEPAAAEYHALISALEFMIDSGVHDFCEEHASDMYGWNSKAINISAAKAAPVTKTLIQNTEIQTAPITEDSAVTPLGKAETVEKAKAILEQVNSIEELKDALQSFDGLSIKNTAKTLVFAEGSHDAPLMIISDMPGADEDLSGQPFAGIHRHFIDSSLKAVGFDVATDSSFNRAYTTSLLNWRPPGNRSPQPAEVEVSLLFLEKHITLIKPKAILALGNLTAKTLLGCKTNINKLRGNWQNYKINGADETIPLMPSFHPSSFQDNSKNKKLFWADLLDVKNTLK